MQVLTTPSEIPSLSYRLLKEARKEILVIFHTANALVRQEKAGAVDLLVESAINYKAQVKILVPIEVIALNTIRRLEGLMEYKCDMSNQLCKLWLQLL